MKKLAFFIIFISALLLRTDILLAQPNDSIDGEQKKWHPVTITFEGPSEQTNNMQPWDNFNRIRSLVEMSDWSNRNWNVSLDEAGSGGLGVTTNPIAIGHTIPAVIF